LDQHNGDDAPEHFVLCPNSFVSVMWHGNGSCPNVSSLYGMFRRPDCERITARWHKANRWTQFDRYHIILKGERHSATQGNLTTTPSLQLAGCGRVGSTELCTTLF